MKHLFLVFITISMINCSQKSNQNNMSILDLAIVKTPLLIDHQRELIKNSKTLIDSSLFTEVDESFKGVETSKLYGIGRFQSIDSVNVAIVLEAPTEDYEGDLFLVSFSKTQKPLDFLEVLELGEIKKTLIEKDTISVFVNYEFSAWEKKYRINENGKFILEKEVKLWEEEYDPN